MDKETKQLNYQPIINFMLKSGKRLLTKAGNIKDIGITKQYLTEEDLRIERGFRKIISGYGKDHVLFAEEENEVFKKSDHLWVVDPISGTKSFIEGEGRYAIVICHLYKGVAQFAAVYDPTKDILFIAYLGLGVFKNGKKVSLVKANSKELKILVRINGPWKDSKYADKILNRLARYRLIQNKYSMSMALCYSLVAMGLVDGVLALTKDSFPEFAGGLIIREAGGVFTNLKGNANIKPTDRIFIGGNKHLHRKLLLILKKHSNKAFGNY
ncbi:MAG: Inositol-1-monophosphatase [Parcubacteria group bacterium GW2011_GWC2_38_7]|nr:MAG: Inositol-1-monophosphatase [Parcubacteria group bacterium GW2011_GWC2_38_7]